MAERKFTLLDDPGLTLYSEKIDNGEKRPTFRIRMVENNPHFQVRTGWSNDKNKGLMEAKFSSRQFYNALETIREVLMSPTPIRLMIQNFDHLFIDGQRQKEPSPHSLFACEKKEDGTVVISVSAGTKRPYIEFDLCNNVNGQGRVYHLFLDADRNPMPKAIAARIATRAYISMAEKYVAAWQVNNSIEPKWMVELRAKNAQNGGMNGHPGGPAQQSRPPQQSQQSNSAPPAMGSMEDADYY